MRSLPIFTASLVLISLLAKPAFAQVMQEKNYQLRLETFSEKPTSVPNPTDEVKPTIIPEKLPVSPNNSPYSEGLNLSVIPGVIDFGIVHATTPVDRKINTSSTSSPEFFLYAYINHGLQDKDSEIPQTSCDNGSCSANIASDWNSTLSFGLGYSCDGKGCDKDFNDNKFRPFSFVPTAFAAPKENESGLKMTSVPVRLNTAATQPPGSYENNITILAVPAL